MSNESTTQRIIEFPKINWAELKKGSLPKGEVAGKIWDALKSLIEVQMLKLTNFLSKDTLDRADEISDQLEELKDQYPQLIGVTQNLLGQQIKDLAEKKGDSRTLFDRLRILAIEATFQGTLQKWDEKDLGRVPMGLRQNFLIQIFNPKTRETIYLLPRNWRNPVHKRIALILCDLSFKARETYKTEKGITAPQKPAETKTESKPKTRKPRSQKQDENTAENKAASIQKKKVTEKIRDKEHEADVRQIKSTKDFEDLNFLKK